MELGTKQGAEGAVPQNEQRAFDPDALTRALRIAGAALVVASASTFMLQHWGDGNDLIRYAMLVGQSLLLAAAAYFVGLSLREGRSARTFLALVLATMPVSFAVLGGLVYSQFHWEAVPTLPNYAKWVAPSAASALLAVLGTVAVLAPLAVVSFVALARSEARALSVSFLCANLLVLAPVRHPLVVVALAGVALVGLLRLELRRFSGHARLDTLEGKLARVMPFAAPLIMLGRVFHLYHAGCAFVGGVLLIAAACAFQVLGGAHGQGRRDAGAWVSAMLAAVGWVCIWPEVAQSFHAGTTATILLLGLPIAMLVGLVSQRAAASRGALLGVATTTALLSALIACAVERDSVAALGCVAVGVGIAVWGASVRALVRTLSGSAVALFGLVVQVWLATRTDNVLRWAGMSALGVLLIVGSAYVERHRGRIARLWEEARARRLAHDNV
ncbi:MAG: hypothetical protein EOO73_30965 [Myxococcales bacterium]|nr:MAG: hypothetical protein EOO73_30965 [Myxococcales bacterium]